MIKKVSVALINPQLRRQLTNIVAVFHSLRCHLMKRLRISSHSSFAHLHFLNVLNGHPWQLHSRASAHDGKGSG